MATLLSQESQIVVRSIANAPWYSKVKRPTNCQGIFLLVGIILMGVGFGLKYHFELQKIPTSGAWASIGCGIVLAALSSGSYLISTGQRIFGRNDGMSGPRELQPWQPAPIM